jgi:hypothetical protein
MDTTMLALIVAFALVFVVGWIIAKQIKEQHVAQDDPMISELKNKITPLLNNLRFTGKYEGLNGRDILNEISVYKGDKSYTINKKKVYLCIVDENGEYYNMNSLMYVFLHEIAHVLCDEIGHTDKFHNIFQEFLVQANTLGIYDPSIPMVSDYCTHND